MSKVVQFSEAASLAIHAVVFIAKSSTSLNVEQVAREIGASRNHLAKVLQSLTKKEILKSVRGPSGGFSMNTEPSQINLLEIFEAIEGKIQVDECPLDRNVCPFNKCLMGGIVSDLSDQFEQYLKNHTLDKFMNNKY